MKKHFNYFVLVVFFMTCKTDVFSQVSSASSANVTQVLSANTSHQYTITSPTSGTEITNSSVVNVVGNYEDQVKEITTINLSYGEAINPELLYYGASKDITWVVKDSNQQVIAQGIGGLANYVFEKPGTYIAELTLNVVYEKVSGGSHGHDHYIINGARSCGLPYYPKAIQINVSNVKMQFLFDEFKLKNPLVGGVVIGNTLSVPVMVTTYDGNPFNYTYRIVKTAGVRTSLIATLDEKYTIIKPGKTTLRYNLSGSVESGTYIMFDFLDASGNISSFALTYPIN